MTDWQAIEDATRHLDPPLATLDVAALDANATDLDRRASALPIRPASKSLRCRWVLEHVLSRPGPPSRHRPARYRADQALPRRRRLAPCRAGPPRGTTFAAAHRQGRATAGRRGRTRAGPAARGGVWLSTAYQRDTAYIAVHQYHRMPRGPYFAAFEAIAAECGGRPHWGKLHMLDARRLADLYPLFGDFVARRGKLDPERRFANPYTTQVFGI